jgi:hypothetical protein
VTNVEVGRDLDARERQRLAAIMRQEDVAQAKLDEILEQRDAAVRSLRWGSDGRAPVMPEQLIAATVSREHPRGLSRTTIHRIVGRVKDQPTSPNGSDQSGTSD